MLVVIISFFVGYGIFALVALPILLSAMFGIRFKHAAKSENQRIKGKGTSVSAVAE